MRKLDTNELDISGPEYNTFCYGAAQHFHYSLYDESTFLAKLSIVKAKSSQ